MFKDENEEDEYITADSWDFLAGQENILELLSNDPTISVPPTLPLAAVAPAPSGQPQEATFAKQGRRICRHIFSCGSPIDIRMRYTPLESIDYVSTAILSVDVSITPHAGTNVMVKDVKVELEGGTVTPLQQLQNTVLKRYDFLTLLFRYQRYGNDGGRRIVSTTTTVVPLLMDSEENSPEITSSWNKTLDFPHVHPQIIRSGLPAQKAVDHVMNAQSSSGQHSPRPGVLGKGRGDATVSGYVPNPLETSSTSHPSLTTISVPHLSITMEVPSDPISPDDEFNVNIQVVNQATRPMRLALYVDFGQPRLPSKVHRAKTDKVLPRTPMTGSFLPSTEASPQNFMTPEQAQEFFIRENELRKGKPLIPLTVEEKIGYKFYSDGF